MAAVDRAVHRLHRVGRVLYGRIEGPTSNDTLRVARVAIFHSARAQQTDKVLMDLRAAQILLEPHDWAATTREAMDVYTVDTRVGILVTSEQRPALWGYCRGMLERGYTRLLFTSPGLAMEWAGLKEIPQPLALAVSSFGR